MLTVKNTENFRIEKPTILTIGTFDGVHLGHQKILDRLQELKAKYKLNTAILTFDPHPRKILFPEQNDLKLITTTDEKLSLLKSHGIDITVVYPFTKKFAQLNPSIYIKDILVKSFKVQHLIIGYDHKFGKNREGDINSLRSYSKEFNYELEEISAHDIDSINISSSKIRHAIEKGDIELANTYLGYPYFLSGTVIKAKQLGRTLGFPTANILVEGAEKLLPATGVYFVEVFLEKKHFYGMLNIGKNPTIDNSDDTKIEVNMFNFNEDIYGSTLKINFLRRLRDEIKFNNLEELKIQLTLDKKNCLQLIETKK